MLNKIYTDLLAFAAAEDKKAIDVLEHAKVFLEGKIAEHKGAEIEKNVEPVTVAANVPVGEPVVDADGNAPVGEPAPVAVGESASGTAEDAAAPTPVTVEPEVTPPAVA